MIIPAIVAEAVLGLEQRLEEFAKLKQNYRRFKNLDVFYVGVLLDYARSATDDDRRTVARLLPEMKVTIEVTREELDWIKKRFKVQATIFGRPMRPSSTVADKVLMRVLEAGIEQGGDN